MRPSLSTAGSQQSERIYSLSKDAALIVAANLVMAICGRLVIPLPFTPIPLALSNFAVLLIGLTLGARRSFIVMALYLIEGAAGMPVFSPLGPGGLTQLLGPTGGYLLSYPFVAAIAGWLGNLEGAKSKALSLVRMSAASTVAEVFLFVCGVSWLMFVTGTSLRQATLFGLYPFLFAEVIKVMLAVAAASRLGRSSRFSHLVS